MHPSVRQTVGTDCDSFDNNNSGCGVKVNKANSYGPPFDANGGGYYAMERTTSHINVYFWARNDANVPSDLKNGASTINTSNWVRMTRRIIGTESFNNFSSLGKASG